MCNPQVLKSKIFIATNAFVSLSFPVDTFASISAVD